MDKHDLELVRIFLKPDKRMDAQGVRSIDDISRLTPGITFVRNDLRNPLSSDIAIRGVSSVDQHRFPVSMGYRFFLSGIRPDICSESGRSVPAESLRLHGTDRHATHHWYDGCLSFLI
jgi:hypothetical protein